MDMANLPADVDAPRAIVAAQQAELVAKTELIAVLRVQLARLRRQQFGRSSERVTRDIEQLELLLEDLEAAQAVAIPSVTADDEPDPAVPSVA